MFVVALVGESPATTYLAPDGAPTLRPDAEVFEHEEEARIAASGIADGWAEVGVMVQVRPLARAASGLTERCR